MTEAARLSAACRSGFKRAEAVAGLRATAGDDLLVFKVEPTSLARPAAADLEPTDLADEGLLEVSAVAFLMALVELTDLEFLGDNLADTDVLAGDLATEELFIPVEERTAVLD